jgi:hypothetical protein
LRCKSCASSGRRKLAIVFIVRLRA